MQRKLIGKKKKLSQKNGRNVIPINEVKYLVGEVI